MDARQFGLIAGRQSLEIEAFTGPIQAAMEEFGIKSLWQRAMFLSQCLHECNKFLSLRECMSYSPKALALVFEERCSELDKNGRVMKGGIPNAKAMQISRDQPATANYVYGGRFGNGDEASGDGWKYRGGGPLQLTFKDNYRQIGQMIGVDLVRCPDLIIGAEVGSRAAAAYWQWRKLNTLADQGDFAAVTRKINAAGLGFTNRKAFYERALEVLGKEAS